MTLRGPHVEVDGLPLRNVAVQRLADEASEGHLGRECLQQTREAVATVPLIEGGAQDIE